MKQIINHDHLEVRIQDLENIMKKEKNRRLYERYQAILLHLKGYKNIQIAEIIGRSNVTIGTYVKRYQQSESLVSKYLIPRRTAPVDT